MAEKNVFDITKLIFQNMRVWACGVVVRELLAPAKEPGSTPGDAILFQPLAKFKLPFVHRLNHNNIITLKSPLGLPQNNNYTKPFIDVRDLITELQVYVQYSIKMR